MERIPQPADTPYTPGDNVTIHLADDDMDVEYHGVKCEVVNVTTDELATVSGRALDSYWYTVKRVSGGEEISLRFRHFDLVPTAEVREE